VLVEGMTIAGIAVGATRGYIYVRSEYPHSIAHLEEAIDNVAAAGYLGPDLLGSGRTFELEVRKGAGAYICGEETALLESLEGKRGIVRAKPPLPALAGLFGKPTVINNVLSLATVPIIMDKGARYYQDYGMGRSRGTLPVQLAGNIKHGGLIEKPSASRCARSCTTTAAAAPRAGRSRRCRWAARSAPICPNRSGTRRSTTKPCFCVGGAGPRRHRGA
jgi:formate dehydrogenase iron-sulfur subunit